MKILKGMLLGAAGGALATGIMSLLMSKLPQPPKPTGEEKSISLLGRHYHEGEISNVAAGRILFETVKSGTPSERTKALLGESVHWGFGIAMGAVYGALRPESSVPDIVGGLVFGTAVWVVASELMVPLLGLSPSPTEQPLEQHAGHAAAHLVYGAVTSATAQGLRKLLDKATSHDEPLDNDRPLLKKNLQLQHFGAAL